MVSVSIVGHSIPPLRLRGTYLSRLLSTPFLVYEQSLSSSHTELGEFHGRDRSGHELHRCPVRCDGSPAAVVVDFGGGALTVFEKGVVYAVVGTTLHIRSVMMR